MRFIEEPIPNRLVVVSYHRGLSASVVVSRSNDCAGLIHPHNRISSRRMGQVFAVPDYVPILLLLVPTA